MRDYILTAIIFAILPVCLLRPWLGIIAWYWLGIMNPHRNTWSFAYTMPFAVLIGGVTLFGGFLMTRDRRPVPWTREMILMVVLMGYFTFTSIFAWAPTHAWAQWEKVFKVVLMTVVATMFIYGYDRIRALMWTIVLSIGFYSVKGFFFVLRTAGAERVQGPDGSFLEGNTFIGLAFTMVLPLMIFMARGEQKVWIKRALYAMAAVTVVSTIFTYSRGAYVGLVVVLPLIFLNAQKKLVAACILIPAALIAPLVLPDSVFKRVDKIENYDKDSSANQRLQSWTVAWNLVKDYPLTGAGFEFEYSRNESRWLSYASEKYKWALQRSSSAHSIYFQMLGQHGYVALLLFLALLLATYRDLSRIKRVALQASDSHWIAGYAGGLQVGLVGYMTAGAFLSSAYFDLAWLYYALTAILTREVGQLPATAVATAVRFSTAPAARTVAGLAGQPLAAKRQD